MIDIKKKENCTGCYACYNVCAQRCIEMLPDEEGFVYPSVNVLSCIGCGLCEAVCPGSLKDDTKLTDLKKPFLYVAKNKNEEERFESSSGGVFTVLARKIIEENGSVFGASFDKGCQKIVHKGIKHIDEISQLRGSKYIQSCVGETYKQVKMQLDSGTKVLYVGTPCQIEGLKSYLGRDYEQLVTLDFVCHGVPSEKVWNAYLRQRENEANSKVKQATFRCKKNGWEKYSVELCFEDGTKYSKVYTEDTYMQAFLRNVSLRPSCYVCQFAKLNRKSDITLADCWGVGNFLPIMDDHRGVSLCLVHSLRGKCLLDAINTEIDQTETELENVLTYNQCIVKPVVAHKKRSFFFKELECLPFDELVTQHAKREKNNKIIWKIKSIIKYIFKID